VAEWLVKPGDEVVEGQPLVTLEDRAGTIYTVVAPRDGIVSTFMAEERDRVYYGDTLGYVLEVAE
ncbi:MAG: dihydrolipoamide succinyltransferase, partial [bacterium]|nr:dihydrolipoamide succinyltransferase [bacterium]